MDKNSEIKFVGQPIFKQIINLVDKVNMGLIVKGHDSERYYKAFKSRTHLITMLFEILSRCDSMTETCEGLRTSSLSTDINADAGQNARINHLHPNVLYTILN